MLQRIDMLSQWLGMNDLVETGRFHSARSAGIIGLHVDDSDAARERTTAFE